MVDKNNKYLAARKAANVSRKEVCEKYHIPYRTLQKWELGLSTPSVYVGELVVDAIKRMGDSKN